MILPAIIRVVIILSISNLANAQSETWVPAKEVIENRCVTCHSCYSSPCQINMQSYAGLLRGANKKVVYDGRRLLPQHPTRMFIDAQSAEEWRDNFDFFPILNRKSPEKSLLLQAVDEKNRRTTPGKKLYSTQSGLTCPKEDQFNSYIKANSSRVMPFGFPALDTMRLKHLKDWGRQGFPGPDSTSQVTDSDLPALKTEVIKWETFLNRSDPKSKIVARYLYEHWFMAHLHFPHIQNRSFRIVRSKSAAPGMISEIASLRPYDDPEIADFSYRLLPIVETIMHKNHILFPLGDQQLEWVTENLLNGKWLVEPMSAPGYDAKSSANPFLTFQQMPLKGRYEFFLHNARYFVMSFIRGPVCEGQVAVNVIQDRFIVFFLAPEFDLAVNDPQFLQEAVEMLILPAAGKSSPIEVYYDTYKNQQKKYAEFRAKKYSKSAPYSFPAVWDGGGHDRNAALTVFRHFDNAGVIQGAWGGPTKTVWVMDYPIFERMYYLLVAGFNVFDNVFHQASTRMYMDNLRVESENNFLYLLPEQSRHPVRDSWYVGQDAQEKMKVENKLFSASYKSDTPLYSGHGNLDSADIVANYTRSLIQNRLKAVVGDRDHFHCCLFDNPIEKDSNIGSLSQLTRPGLAFAQYMPEMTILAYTDTKGKTAEVLFLTKETGHKNVSFLFDEQERLNPVEDRLVITRDWVGSYPNFLIYIDSSRLGSFSSELAGAMTKQNVENVLEKYGTSRTNPGFWQTYDVFESLLNSKFPLEYGRLDISKYVN